MSSEVKDLPVIHHKSTIDVLEPVIKKIISSYLATEDHTIEKEMIGNWFEAATWVSYSLRTKFKLKRKHSLFIKII